MNASIIQLDELPVQTCPCGSARRGFRDLPGAVASMHLVEVSGEAAIHHHEHTTELYYILEGSGFIELDGQRVPVRPGSAIYIPPGVRHRAVGHLKLLNVPVPPFDPRDEHLD